MSSFDLGDSDNPRDEELSTLKAIYPEIQQIHPDDPYTIAIDIAVKPSKPVVVYFPAVSDPSTEPAQQAQTQTQNNGTGSASAQDGNESTTGSESGQALDLHELDHLPPVHIEMILGPKYPADQPPSITISANPPWLPKETIKQLEDDGPRLWEDIGRDMVGFTYIDHIKERADSVFDLVDDKGSLTIDPQHKIAILDYDMKARRADFEKETFECGVCLDVKKGSACHRMMDCGHVFCVDCLQACYNQAITEGDLAAVRCLEPNCAKERSKAAESSSSGRKKRRKPKTYISPSELLQIPIDQETVKRYVTLKYKTELESDKNTIYCPRQWCNGAARSKKHRKPQGLELAESSDESGSSDDDGEDADENKASAKAKKKKAKATKKYDAAAELLAICEECNFAFCSRCYQSWHGEFKPCVPRRDKEELTEEEKASLEYMRLHTSPCPTCAAPAQKTHGCNHMICYRCQTHFCYLCSAWLDPSNPYTHFNEAPGGMITGCYMRLWELEHGDGNDVGIGFGGGVGGGRAPAPAPAQDGEVLLIPEIEEPSSDEEEEPVGPADQAQEGQQAVGVAREGPLVLRIAGNRPAGAGRGGPRRPGDVPAGQRAQPAVPDAPGGGAAVNLRGGGRGGGGGAQNNNHGQAGNLARRGRGERFPQRGARVGRGGRGAGGGGGGGGDRIGVRGNGHHHLPPHRQNDRANQAQQQGRNPANNNNNNRANQNHHDGGAGGGDGHRFELIPAAVFVDLIDGGFDMASDDEEEDVVLDGLPNGHDDVLDPQHQEWIRRFIDAALRDEEESDDDI